jgi:hypothetical protein
MELILPKENPQLPIKIFKKQVIQILIMIIIWIKYIN